MAKFPKFVRLDLDQGAYWLASVFSETDRAQTVVPSIVVTLSTQLLSIGQLVNLRGTLEASS